MREAAGGLDEPEDFAGKEDAFAEQRLSWIGAVGRSTKEAKR